MITETFLLADFILTDALLIQTVKKKHTSAYFFSKKFPTETWEICQEIWLQKINPHKNDQKTSRYIFWRNDSIIFELF